MARRRLRVSGMGSCLCWRFVRDGALVLIFVQRPADSRGLFQVNPMFLECPEEVSNGVYEG
jgi:hypothetical protein